MVQQDKKRGNRLQVAIHSPFSLFYLTFFNALYCLVFLTLRLVSLSAKDIWKRHELISKCVFILWQLEQRTTHFFISFFSNDIAVLLLSALPMLNLLLCTWSNSSANTFVSPQSVQGFFFRYANTNCLASLLREILFFFCRKDTQGLHLPSQPSLPFACVLG